MRYETLPGTGLQASVLCMGSTYFGSNTPEPLVFELLDAYADLGGNFIDTARMYGDFSRDIPGLSEACIGRWMKARGNRQQIVLATKGGHPPLRHMDQARLDRNALTYDLTESLRALQTDHIDLYWLHRDDPDRPVADILETLNGFVRAGYVRAFGASNWKPERIYEANRWAAGHGLMGFVANEPQWSLARQDEVEDPTLVQMDSALYRFHCESGLTCVPFSSQAKGFYIKLSQLGAEGLSDKARRRYLTEHNLAIYRVLEQLTQETGLSVGALALAYLTSQPFPVFPIVGVSQTRQVAALAEAGEARLSPEALEQLMALTGLR